MPWDHWPICGPILSSPTVFLPAMAGTVETLLLAVPFARPGMRVLINPRATLGDTLGIAHYHVESIGIVQLIIHKLTGAPNVPGDQTFDVALFLGGAL